MAHASNSLFKALVRTLARTLVPRLRGLLWELERLQSVAALAAPAKGKPSSINESLTDAAGENISQVEPVVSGGPPADWLEKVRRGAPHLLRPAGQFPSRPNVVSPITSKPGPVQQTANIESRSESTGYPLPFEAPSLANPFPPPLPKWSDNPPPVHPCPPIIRSEEIPGPAAVAPRAAAGAFKGPLPPGFPPIHTENTDAKEFQPPALPQGGSPTYLALLTKSRPPSPEMKVCIADAPLIGSANDLSALRPLPPARKSTVADEGALKVSQRPATLNSRVDVLPIQTTESHSRVGSLTKTALPNLPVLEPLLEQRQASQNTTMERPAPFATQSANVAVDSRWPALPAKMETEWADEAQVYWREAEHRRYLSQEQSGLYGSRRIFNRRDG